MKKVLVLLVVFALVFALAACGNNNINNANTENEQGNVEPPGDDDVEFISRLDVCVVPSEYSSAAEHQGRLEQFSYTTGELTKTAYVYLPYGYDEEPDRRYDVVYFLHGAGGNAGQFYNRGSYSLNDILDHAIENGDIEPIIFVTASYYIPGAPRDSSVEYAWDLLKDFDKEFINDLMPQLEAYYRTYAETTDPAGLEASRKHRAFGGFSMGSVCTWYQLTHSMDYVAYFLPFSGVCWETGYRGGGLEPEKTAEFLSDSVLSSKYSDDFYVFSMTGEFDVDTGEHMLNQHRAMARTEGFRFADSWSEGNTMFLVMEGAEHSYKYYRSYIYTALQYIF